MEFKPTHKVKGTGLEVIILERSQENAHIQTAAGSKEWVNFVNLEELPKEQGNFQHRELSGTLFKNKEKKKENSPDFIGRALIDGKIYIISGWAKQSANKGTNYLSLSFVDENTINRGNPDEFIK